MAIHAGSVLSNRTKTITRTATRPKRRSEPSRARRHVTFGTARRASFMVLVRACSAYQASR